MADPTMQALRDEDAILAGIVDGMGLAQDDGMGGGEKCLTLSERFGVPPFSVLDARRGYWQDRKRAWLAIGIQSELGRGDTLLLHSEEITTEGLNYYRKLSRKTNTASSENGKGRKVGTLGAIAPNESGESGILSRTGKYATGKDSNGLLGISRKGSSAVVYGTAGSISEQTGTSIFDPVLCELAYRWFMPQSAGKVLDPFAGGSVRGIVASKLGKDYTGVDLSERQIEANRAQAAVIVPDKMPRWIVGDSTNISELAGGEYDMIFSCPPYADLEVYSDDPADLSCMGYADFITAYRKIIAQCVAMLKDNRFACFVVGDIRDNKGFYRNFPADTIEAFEDAGATLYNEAVLVTAIGSLPIRVGRQFDSGRKLGKTHQNVLVFYKGNPKAIKDFGAVEFGDFEELESANEIPD